MDIYPEEVNLNKVRQEFLIVQCLVEQQGRLPSYQDIATACGVSHNRVQSIVRRYMIYQYIDKYKQTKGYPPSRRDVSDALRIPLSVVQYHLDKLSQAQLIEIDPDQSRAIHLLEEGDIYG